MPLYTLTIHQLHPWPEFNEYEGHLEGVIDGRDFCAYVLMHAGDQWQQYAAGDTLSVDLWLERSGPLTIHDTPVAPALRQLEGILYQATGRVTHTDGDSLWLDITPSLRIDLDPPVNATLPAVHPGDYLTLIGTLKVDLDPDEEE